MLHRITGLALLLVGTGTASPLAPQQGFSFTKTVNRFVTPNGDGKNDTAVFQYANPQDSSGSIRIYEMRGHLVATITIDPGTTTATWNPGAIANGVYIYVITIDQVSRSGVLVVVR